MYLAKKEVLCGQTPPRFYRTAYFDVVRGYFYCYPIGIHWLVRWWQGLLSWTWRWNPTKRECELYHAERSGYNKGYERGMENGFNVAVDAIKTGKLRTTVNETMEAIRSLS